MHSALLLLRDALGSATLWTALATIVVGFYTYYARQQWKAMADTFREARRSADVAQEALNVSRDQLRISVRPWVGIVDEPGGLQTTPLAFDGQGNASIQYSITVKNFSNSAAQNVMTVAFLIVTEDIEAIRAKQLEARGDNFVGKTDMGFLLFPGRDRVSIASASVFPRAQMVSKSYTGKFEAFLVGCIGYRDQFGVVYHTNFIHWLVDPRTSHPIEFDVIPNTNVQGAFIPWHSSLD